MGEPRPQTKYQMARNRESTLQCQCKRSIEECMESQFTNV